MSPPTVSFSRAKQQAQAAAAPAPTTAPSSEGVPPSNAVAEIPKPQTGLVGEFNSNDLKRPPFLTFVSGNGELAVNNPEWLNKFVWDKSVCLGGSLVVVCTRVAKFYKEQRPYPDTDPIPPQRWFTEAEAKASGLPYHDAANLDLLVEVPESLVTASPLETHAAKLGGKYWVPTVFSVQRTAYDCARTIVQDWNRWLKGNGKNGQYKLESSVRQGKSGPYRAPCLKSHGATPEEFRADVLKGFGI